MTKADERALAYAKSHAYLGYDYDQTYDAVKYGYLQAEKDLALTWEDMNLIDSILIDMQEDGVEKYGGLRQYYEETLKRFNEQRKK